MLHITIECTDRSATVYVSGALSIPGLWQLIRTCDEFPAHIRSLRIDLQGVRVVQSGVVEALAPALRVWRENRNGITRVDLPKAGLGIQGRSAPPAEQAAPS